MSTSNLPRRLKVLCLVLGYIAVASTRSACGQATLTASKGADIFVFGGYTYAVPDYGPSTVHNNGITFGADYARYFGWRIQPALELRYTNVSGPIVKESTIGGGLRGHINLGASRYHPYIDILAGGGTISYVEPPLPNYPPDHGFVLAYGGGIDIDLVHNVLFKADFQFQSWNLGKNAVTVPNGEDYTLTPMATTIGVAYRLPFRSYVGGRYHNLRDEKPEKPGKSRPAPPPPPASTTPPAAPTDTTAHASGTPSDQPAASPAADQTNASPAATPTDQTTVPAQTTAPVTSSAPPADQTTSPAPAPTTP